jgi:hypothetical protein
MLLSRHRNHTFLVCVVTAALLAAVTVPVVDTASASTRTPAAPPAPTAATTAAELEAALDAAEARAAQASTRALDAQRRAELARAEADEAATRAGILEEQRSTADAQSVASAERAATVAAALYRDSSDGPLLARLLTSAEPETLLARLELWDRLGAVAARANGSAREASAVAAALDDQAQVAEDARRRLAEIAESEAARAAEEAGAEASAVDAARQELDDLYARLAALRRTTAEIERQARLDRQTAQQQAAGPGPSGAPPAAIGGSPATPASPSSPAAPANPGAGSGGTGAPAPTPPAAPAPAPAPSAPAPPPPAPPASGEIMSPAQAQAHARAAIGAYGWGDDQFSCLVSLWNRESGWRVQARNPSSGAYGIPQAYPAEKLAAAGPDWRTSAPTQISWGLSYIRGRYGSPCGAWAHSQSTGWY